MAQSEMTVVELREWMRGWVCRATGLDISKVTDDRSLEEYGLSSRDAVSLSADLEDLIRSLWHKLGVTILFVTHDIDESVYLGQRVLVLSSSPTVIMEDLAIDLPDERNQLETRSSPRFAELRGHVYEQIQLAKHRKGDQHQRDEVATGSHRAGQPTVAADPGH